MISYILAETNSDYAAAASLFKEYVAWLNIDLTFQHFDEELLELEEMYALPRGGIILCKDENKFVACVGIRRLDQKTAEMKRMYVQPAFQRKGIADELVKRSLQLAKRCNYKLVKLDTLNTMMPAMNLYKKYGFTETKAYYHNPNDTVVYFEKIL